MKFAFSIDSCSDLFWPGNFKSDTNQAPPPPPTSGDPTLEARIFGGEVRGMGFRV